VKKIFVGTIIIFIVFFLSLSFGGFGWRSAVL